MQVQLTWRAAIECEAGAGRPETRAPRGENVIELRACVASLREPAVGHEWVARTVPGERTGADEVAGAVRATDTPATSSHATLAATPRAAGECRPAVASRRGRVDEAVAVRGDLSQIG